MIVDPSLPPPPPPDAAADVTPQLNAEKIQPSDDGVDLIGDSTSWPSLSESTRPSPKSSPSPSSDSPIATCQAPASSQSPQNHRHSNTNTTSNPNTNRQRSSSRGGFGRGGASRGGFIRHPPPPQQLPSPPPLPPAFYGGFEGGPMRGPFFYSNGFGPHPRPSDHQFPQPSSPHRGRRFNHANHRGPDWNAAPQAPQGFHHRDVRFAQPGPMGYPMPPQQLMPFPFMHPPMLPEPFMGMPPYNGGHAPVPPPPVDLQTKLLNQINYYFSDENLVKDMYLRSQMDNGGWVPVTLIANFNKVRELTQDIQLVLETLAGSAVVEIQGDKMRRRNDWKRWIPISSVREEPITEVNTIMRYLQNATLEEVHAAADRTSSGAATNASFSPREVLT